MLKLYDPALLLRTYKLFLIVRNKNFENPKLISWATIFENCYLKLKKWCKNIVVFRDPVWGREYAEVGIKHELPIVN